MKLSIEKVNYKYKDLEPVMSKDTLEYHRDNLAAAYVKNYNEDKGDKAFNEAGAFLHNIFFPQLKSPSGSNKPFGSSLALIEERYGSFEEFKEEFEKIAMGIQGSGWVYMSPKGEIKTIKNHEVKKDIVLLVDWWEHAWSLDYQSRKGEYLKNIWKIINWSVVNDRLNLNVNASRKNVLLKICKKASSDGGLPKTFPRSFRRWLRESVFRNQINQNYDIGSRSRIANYLFNKESYISKLRLYEEWSFAQELKEKMTDETPIENRPPDNNKVEMAQPEQLSLFGEV